MNRLTEQGGMVGTAAWTACVKKTEIMTADMKETKETLESKVKRMTVHSMF